MTFNMRDAEKELKTGTTTVGIVCNDGVVLASDSRATMGYLISNQEMNKVLKLSDKIGMTIAGSVGDALMLVRIMQAEINLYKYENGKDISVKAAATLLSNHLQSNKWYPYYTSLIVGGINSDNTPDIYTLDPAGGMTQESHFCATGSGSTFVYGLLEDYLKDGKKKETKEIVPIVIRAIRAAMRRDAGSGGYPNIAVITKKSYHVLSKQEIEQIEKEKI